MSGRDKIMNRWMDSAPAGRTRRRAVAGRVLLALFVGAALSACGGKSVKVSERGDRPAVAGTPTTQQGTSRGGAYYKDDGPDDVIPAGLDQIPDAVPRIEALHPPALRPYSVFGQQYVPMTELRPHREEGLASWYGRRFHGNPTSTGETYDMYAMTAAHPTLPLPSYARVTNLENGRSVVVRVNDRGPFLRGRIIDLSYVAAHRLGYINAGSARVEVAAITHEDIRVAEARGLRAEPGLATGTAMASVPVRTEPVARAPVAQPPMAQAGTTSSGTAPAASTTPPAGVQIAPSLPLDPTPAAPSLPVVSGPGGSGAYLQLGAFSTPAYADSLMSRVRAELSAFADRLHIFDEGGRYRLQLGPFASADEARFEARRIGALLDVQPFVVMR